MFENIKGHKRQVSILSRQLERDNLSHAYLFSGVEGIGKRTVAENLAIEIIRKGLENKNRHLSLDHADIVRIGSSENPINIGDIRDLIKETVVTPLEGEYRVFIIDHADKMNPLAQNALLKTIEEPRKGNIFILITSNPSKLLDTIKSRCQKLPFKDILESQKQEVLNQLGYQNYQGDLSLSVGHIIEQIDHPEREKTMASFYNRLKKVLKGDSLEAFSLAEEVSKDRLLAEETIQYWIRALYREPVSEENIFSIKTLFELYDKLSYNVNLRLQLEGSLLKLVMEHQNGKKYSGGKVSGFR